jgi:hypothetical protein
MITRAPSAAKACAVTRPIPLLPPVTSTVFPSKRFMMFSYEHAFGVKGIVVSTTWNDVRTGWPSRSKKLDEFAGAGF